MKNSTKILLGIGSVALVVVAILGVLGIIDAETAMGAGAMMASAPVGFVGADAASTSVPTVGADGKVDGSVKTYGKGADGKITHPEMNKDTISQKLAKVLPSNYPLDTFLRNIGSGKTNSDKYGFYSIVARGVEAIVGGDAATGTAALGASVVIKLSSGVHCLSKDGDLLVPSRTVSEGKTGASALANGEVALNPLVLHIIGIDYAKSEITVMGVNGNIPALAVGTKLYRMASAKDQEAAMSDDPMATPTKEYNFVQRNLCTISENAFQALQDKEVQYGLAEFKEQALLDFRYQAEITSLFGAAYAGNIEGEMIDQLSQKRKMHMKGLTSFIGNQIKKGAQQSIPQFLNQAMEELFANNNGSEERIILYGAGFATALANDAEAWKKQIEGAKTEVKWGITWKVIETNFGRLLGLMHTGLGMVGYGHCAFVIDPANIRRISQLDLTQTELDLKKAGYRNSKDITLDEAWTLEVTNPSCHGMLVIPEAAV